jgi:hypothetical protein
MEKRANSRSKLSPELMVINYVDCDHPKKEKDVDNSNSDVFSHLMQVLE